MMKQSFLFLFIVFLSVTIDYGNAQSLNKQAYKKARKMATKKFKHINEEVSFTKEFDPITKKIKTKFKKKGMTKAKLRKLRKRNREARKAKFGKIAPELWEALEGMKQTDSIDVRIKAASIHEKQHQSKTSAVITSSGKEPRVIFDKIPPHRAVKVIPLGSANEIIAHYNLKAESHNKVINDITFDTKTTKKVIKRMMRDKSIGSVHLNTPEPEPTPLTHPPAPSVLNSDLYGVPAHTINSFWRMNHEDLNYRYWWERGAGARIGWTETALFREWTECKGFPSANYHGTLKTNYDGVPGDAANDHDDHAMYVSSIAYETAMDAEPYFYEGRGLKHMSPNFIRWLVDNEIDVIGESFTSSGNPNTDRNLATDDLAYLPGNPPLVIGPSGNTPVHPLPRDPCVTNWRSYNRLSVGGMTNNMNYGYWWSPEWGGSFGPYTGDCTVNNPGEGETPHLVAVAESPRKWIKDHNNDDVFLASDWIDECWQWDPDNVVAHGTGHGTHGTSLAAPGAAGVATTLIGSYPLIYKAKPIVTTMALVLNAENVDGRPWSPAYGDDGEDGTGGLSKGNAHAWSQRAQRAWGTPYPDDLHYYPPTQYGYDEGHWQTGWNLTKQFNIKITEKPVGKIFRIVLMWTSRPSEFINHMSDMDLYLRRADGGIIGYSTDWGGNIEVIEINSSELTIGEDLIVDMAPYDIDLPEVDKNFFKYAIGWTWVNEDIYRYEEATF